MNGSSDAFAVIFFMKYMLAVEVTFVLVTRIGDLIGREPSQYRISRSSLLIWTEPHL